MCVQHEFWTPRRSDRAHVAEHARDDDSNEEDEIVVLRDTGRGAKSRNEAVAARVGPARTPPADISAGVAGHPRRSGRARVAGRGRRGRRRRMGRGRRAARRGRRRGVAKQRRRRRGRPSSADAGAGGTRCPRPADHARDAEHASEGDDDEEDEGGVLRDAGGGAAARNEAAAAVAKSPSSSSAVPVF